MFFKRIKTLCAFLPLFANFKQVKNSLWEKIRDLRDTMPRHWPLCFLLSPCYLQDTMQCQWSSSDLPRVLRIWESVFYSQVFFIQHSFLLVSRPPWGWQFNLKVSRVLCNRRKIAPVQLFAWITTIHKRVLGGRSI